MDVIPTGSTSRPVQGKSAKTKIDSPKPAARSRPAKVPGDQTEAARVHVDISQSIATTAYFLAAARNFEPGHELDDWLEAERQVRAAAQ